MEEEKLIETLLHIFSKHLNDPTLRTDAAYADHAQWSSLKALVIVNEIEQHTHVLLSGADLGNHPSVQAIAAKISSLEPQ